MKYATYFLILILLGGLAIGNSPIPPYHHYELMGTLVDSTLEARDSLYVLIYSKTDYGEYKPLTGTEYGDLAVGRTSATGYFYVSATSRKWTDSIRLAFFGPDLRLMFSEPMGIPDSLTTKVYSSEPVIEDQDEFLWFTCNTEYVNPLVGYEHRWTDLEISLSPSNQTEQRLKLYTGPF
jgi:hypothetical protein